MEGTSVAADQTAGSAGSPPEAIPMQLRRTFLTAAVSATLAVFVGTPALIARAADNPWLSPSFMVTLNATMMQFVDLQARIKRLEGTAALETQANLAQQAAAQSMTLGKNGSEQAIQQQRAAANSFIAAGTAVVSAGQALSNNRRLMQTLIANSLVSLNAELKKSVNPQATGPVAAAQKAQVLAKLALLEKELLVESAAAAKNKKQIDALTVSAQSLANVSKQANLNQLDQVNAQKTSLQNASQMMQNVMDPAKVIDQSFATTYTTMNVPKPAIDIAP